MYGYREFNGGGEFIARLLGGKVFRFEHTVDGSDKRRAKEEMDSEVQEARDALAKKLGRRPTDTEILAGGVTPKDERPFKQRLAEDMTHTTGARSEMEARNPYKTRLEYLQQQHPLRREDKAALKRRVVQAKYLSAKWNALHAEAVTEKRENDRISSAVVDAKASLALMRSGGVPEEVRIAQRLLDTLQKDHDLEAYYTQADALSAQRKARLEESAQALEAKAEEQRKLAAGVRRGEVSTEVSAEVSTQQTNEEGTDDANANK
jgi:hypothetical protein